MEIVNPGNVLPFYARKESKMRYRAGCKEFNWAIPVALGQSLPFQIPVIADTPPFVFDVVVLDENEEELAIVDTSFLLYSEDEDGNAWLTYKGDNSDLNAMECGVYSFKLENERGGFAYSEDFRIMNFGQKENAYKLTFSNDTDIDGIIYQGGYEQKLWILDAIFDTPEVVEATENATDGDAIEVLTFQSVQTRDVLRFPYFPDFWHSVFPRLKMIDNLLIQKLQTSQLFDIADSGLAFTTEEQDMCFKKGVLSWIASTQVMVGCETNKVMVYLDNEEI